MTPALHVKDLFFRYGDDNRPEGWSLDVPDLTLEAGEHFLLTGGSGSGKSTLLYLIAGLIDPDRGRVTVDGQDVHGLRGAARDRFRGRTMGVIFQTHQLLTGFTAVENVMAALMFSELASGEHRGRAAALLEQLGVDAIDRRVDRLSVGQQQRVAVARAIAVNPTLVLADEPTASLDPESALVTIDLIVEACRSCGAALLCVSHDPNLANRFPQRAALDRLGGRPAGATTGSREGES